MPDDSNADRPSLGLDPVARWLLAETRPITDSAALLGGFANRLVESGFPLARLFVGMRTLHPQVMALSHYWRTGDAVTQVTPRAHGTLETDTYLMSPVRVILEHRAEELRCNLETTEPPFEFPIFGELKAEGITDYLLLPLPFSGVGLNTLTIATVRAGGFRAAEIERFRALVPLLALVLEIREDKRVASTLLTTYLGPETGRRVLAGQVRRGDGTSIAAALFYCDLRGFTRMSEALPRAQLIAMLNDYFATMAAPVEKHGGEVLKFIGDAMLAIFPIADDLDRDRACITALAAAREAIAAMDELNRRRRAAEEIELRAGIALHTGTVMYGNIGAPDRLDFTVIGPAVNLVFRLERLCRTLGRRLVASGRFASPCGLSMLSLGRHELPGVTDPVEVFGLPEEGEAR
jgi:adenylate cyclase